MAGAGASLWRRTRSSVSISRPRSSGLGMEANTPRGTGRVVPAPETTTMGSPRSEGSCSARAITSHPVITGIIRSRSTTSGRGYREWLVTDQVRAIYETGANFGFLIQDALEEGASSEQQFHSREKGASQPQLIIRYAAAGLGQSSSGSAATKIFVVNLPLIR